MTYRELISILHNLKEELLDKQVYIDARDDTILMVESDDLGFLTDSLKVEFRRIY